MPYSKKQLADTIHWYQDKIKEIKQKLRDMEKRLKQLKRHH